MVYGSQPKGTDENSLASGRPPIPKAPHPNPVWINAVYSRELDWRWGQKTFRELGRMPEDNLPKVLHSLNTNPKQG